jgi:hypothetical protein
MGHKAVKMHAAASRARKKAQQSEPVKLSDSESPADIELSGSESPAAVKHSNMVNDDFAAIEVSHYLKDSELQLDRLTNMHISRLPRLRLARPTDQLSPKSVQHRPNHRPEKSLPVNLGSLRPNYRSTTNQPTNMHRQLLVFANTLHMKILQMISRTTNTDTIAKKVTGVMNVPTGKLTKKSKAKAKQMAVEIRSDSDDNDDNSDSAKELEGKYIP